MPPKKRITLSESVREALINDVALTHQAAIEADERDKIRIYLAVEQGLTTGELAEGMGVSQSAVSNWRRQGEEAFKRREEARNRRGSVDTGRSAELAANGG